MANGINDFDFLYGNWNVAHRRLKERLAHCTEWEEFAGTITCTPLMGGQGNVDDTVLELPSGKYHGVGLRAYDAATQTWAIWWLDSRNPAGIDVPVRGRFENGFGTFLADEIIQGKPVRVRFLWDIRQAEQPIWAQAFSEDAGKTWETNWVMTLTRHEK